MATAGERQAAAEVLAKAKARTARVALVLDGDLLAEHERLSAQLDKFHSDTDDAIELAGRIVALEEQIVEAEVEFVFRGLGRGRWRALLAEHPPTEDDKKQGLEFSADEFPFVAMAASLVEPVLTVDDLRALHDEALSETSFSELWTACLKANLGGGSSRPESQAARATLENAGGKSKLQSVSA